MPRHPDAIGYLNDLTIEVDKHWFTMACSLAAISGKSTLDRQDIDTLLALFTEQASFLGVTPLGTLTTTVTTSAVASDFLETLSSFSNFKRLEGTLQVSFAKRITLIFGANGSGKSSLCESLKVLACPEPPTRPIHNVRADGTATPGFSYKFKTDASAQTWTPIIGYGPRRSTVKYFDAGIALKNVRSAVEPGRVIELTPFKLHVFEWAKSLTIQFREALQIIQSDNALKLKSELDQISVHFGKFKGRPLSFIDEKTAGNLTAEIKIGEAFTDQALLEMKLTAMSELEKATSEEGLKLLKAERRELEAFLAEIETLLDSAEGLWEINPGVKAKELAAKQAAQEVLAKELIPEGVTLERLLSLIRPASTLCRFENAVHQACPLCRRDLGVPEIALFQKYHELLADGLDKDITALRGDLKKAGDLAEVIAKINPAEWNKSSTLSVGMLTEAKAGAAIIKGNCGLEVEHTSEAITALDALTALCVKGTESLEQKTKTIETAEKGRGELLKQLAELRAEIEPLEYAWAIFDRIAGLKETERMAQAAVYWNSSLSTFTPLLRKITEAAKKAHEELVVSDFENRLNAEYKALTEKDMIAFGVKLKNIGGDATVTVSSKIGGKEIEDVLSEGEQRVHALALFFAELETCSESVLVFDDPISSFDYNYIANYCRRLRDFAQSHPARQIIILTHNWEFFVQLQKTIHDARPSIEIEIQVLENCSSVAEYSEDVTKLKSDISALLTQPGEPKKTEKEKLAGQMRRLIEAVVNRHVFNNQRHQYKQKSNAVSSFHEFTKLVRLDPAEATTLKDLYADLSISEHDDPRNAYVNTDKATFQSRYDRIINIESAVISRR